jgi:hypothetical protein
MGNVGAFVHSPDMKPLFTKSRNSAIQWQHPARLPIAVGEDGIEPPIRRFLFDQEGCKS